MSLVTAMKDKLFLIFLLIIPVSIFASDEDVFAIANKLKQSIIAEDIEYLRSLDHDGNLVEPENLKYVFDSNWIKKFDSEKISISELLTSHDILTFVEKHDFQGRDIFYIYWSINDPQFGVQLSNHEWLKSNAACALEKKNDGNWYLFNHLCFAETEGPYQ